MSTFGAGWVPVRRGILDHIYDGRLTPSEHHALLSMFLLADASTGVWRGSAPALTTVLGYTSQRTMATAFEGLEAKGYILRDYAPGGRGNFPILIGKFEITRGDNAGRRVDLDATKNQCGIPHSRISKVRRKPLLASISAACRTPTLTSGVRTVSDRDSSETRTGFVGGMYLNGKPGNERIETSTEGEREGVLANHAFSLDDPEHPFTEFPERATATSTTTAKAEPVCSPQAGTLASTTATSTDEISPATPGPPAVRLAQHYFRCRQNPQALWSSVVQPWPHVFESLLQSYTESDLASAITWAFEADPFWRNLLCRQPNISVELFSRNADTIISRWRLSIPLPPGNAAAPNSAVQSKSSALLNRVNDPTRKPQTV